MARRCSAPLTGHAAFERRSGEQVVAQFLRITSQPIPDLREQGLPDDVAAVIEHAMARDPSDRPATAAEFGDELREIQRSHGLPSTRWRVPSSWRGTPSRRGAVDRSCAHLGDADTAHPGDKYRPPVALRSLVARDRLADVLRAAGGGA